jgi:Transcriptional regulator containing PAS, AAA-type ATPase, and DNA-binding domains
MESALNTQLSKILSCFDAMLIVNNEAKLLYLYRYNLKFGNKKDEDEFRSFFNNNYLKMYPSINQKDSSILKCLETKAAIYKNNQSFYDYKGRFYCTENFTLPILQDGKVFGAIELSKDISNGNTQFNINKYIKDQNSLYNYTFDDIITKNKHMERNIEYAKMIADSPSPVLIHGETGTGKELFAQAIHNFSNRRNFPFVAQNCAALPESLFESIFFGTVSGAFTGAHDKPGLLELANRGTLFLDEINSLSISMQTKLLRVLQDGIVRRIGDTRDRRVDVRTISAMNIDPLEALRNSQIRQDFFYRINVVNIGLTPLRSRREDILLYTYYFIQKNNLGLKRNVKGICHELEEAFKHYSWPGNVRELQHVIEAAMNVTAGEIIEAHHLPAYFKDALKNENYKLCQNTSGYFSEAIGSIEKELIVKALKESNGNVKDAGVLLNIPRQTLQYKLKKYEINHKMYFREPDF